MNKIAVFIDYDNIEINMKTTPPEKFSRDLGYKRFKEWLSSFGEICVIFIFAPDNSSLVNGEYFYKYGFINISCPILIDREKIETDELEHMSLGGRELEFEPSDFAPIINTTDAIMINTAKIVINLMPEITHICIASGDGDFMPIVKMAQAKNKKLMIMIGGFKSSSRDLLKEADRDENNKKMIHIFDPIKN